MHDPLTQAFNIKNPFARSVSEFNGHRNVYYAPLITIWHKDPEQGTVANRRDDSCGWFTPPYTQAQLDAFKKIVPIQFSQLLAHTVAKAEGKDYAYICYDQDCYGAIYWLWRAIKALNKKGWQYGKPLSPEELDAIYKLATNPVDNLQHMWGATTNAEEFGEFAVCVWRNYLRHHRPWYRHPRWHIHHWRIQVHPWQQLKRRFWDRCDICKKRGFKKGDHAMGDWSGKRIWHGSCAGIQSGSTNAI